MRIIVTGGAGFIGSALIRLLLRETCHEVVNIDKLTYAANLSNLEEVLPNGRYSFQHIDICDSTAVRSIFDRFRPGAVLHLAAESHVDRSIDGPWAFLETNIIGTYKLLEESRRYLSSLPQQRREAFRFHHVSTDEVFGSLGSDGFFTEETRYAPNSPYSATKASSDMLVRAWHHTFGIPTITTNCSNNYGPYQFPEKLIPVAILAALEGRPIPVYGQGKNVRDWLYVEDHARALLAILERGRPGENYNIGGNSEAANIDLVTSICAILDELLPTSRNRPHAGLISFVADRPGHDLRYAIDCTKLEQELGWSPQVSLPEGLRRTVEWYLENRSWWHPLRHSGEQKRLGLRVQ